MPYNIASFGGEIDDLTVLITWLTVVCLIIAEVLFFWFLFRFRKRPGNKSQFIPGETWAQLKWVFIPVILVVGLDVFIDIQNAHAWKTIKEELPKEGIHVRITGQQFSWTFTVPGDGKTELDGKNDIVSPNELVVPVDTNIIWDLESKDVLHSFWVPALRLKQDAVPGRTWKGWFKATRTGIYDIGCAEICGTDHAKMAARLHVVYPEDYKLYCQKSGLGNAPPGLKLLTTKGCLGCHTIDGSPKVGPSYKGIYGTKVTVDAGGTKRQVTIDDAYLKKSILEPAAEVVEGFPNVMPPQTGNVTDEEVGQIIDYIKTLK